MPALFVLLDLVVTALAFVVLALVFGYPWQLAVLLAFALGALSYSSRRTVSNLRRIWRRDPSFERDSVDDDAPISGARAASATAPGKEHDAEDEQKMHPAAERDPDEQQHEPGRK